MLRLTLSEEDMKELDYQRYHHAHPRVQRKMEALLLKAKGLPHHQIARLAWACVKTRCAATRQQYQTGGIEALTHVEFRRPTSELETHHDTIEASLREHPVTTIPQAVKRIEEVTGIKRSPTQVGIFLKKLGLKRLKTSAIPAKCNGELQATFKKTNESRGWSKPKPVSAPSFSSMRPILSWEPTWAGYGVSPACWCARPADGNASMC